MKHKKLLEDMVLAKKCKVALYLYRHNICSELHFSIYIKATPRRTLAHFPLFLGFFLLILQPCSGSVESLKKGETVELEKYSC